MSKEQKITTKRKAKMKHKVGGRSPDKDYVEKKATQNLYGIAATWNILQIS